MEHTADKDVMPKCATSIYKILSKFEEQLDYETFDTSILDPKMWKLSEPRFYRYLRMLEQNGYIEGVTIKDSLSGGFICAFTNPQITLKGIEYLADNSVMQKAMQVIKKGAELSVQIIP